MFRFQTSSFFRRLLVASVAFGIFVLLDIALFGWLIFRSLSQREIEEILVETRTEAEGLARRIAGRAESRGEDLYTAITLERETQTYIDSILRQRDIVKTVEIRDKDGKLVFQSRSEATLPVLDTDAPRLGSPEMPAQVEKRTLEYTSTYDVTVPIGDLGILHIGISPEQLKQRIEVLRGELIRQATLIGTITVVLLLAAYACIWLLLRRSRRLEEEKAEAERMAYIGTLAAGLAHEIRNPLNSLNLNMQMLQEESTRAGHDASTRRLLAITRAEIKRLERLVTDFLSYARPRPLELREVPAVELLEHVLEVQAGEMQARGVRVEVEDLSGGAVVKVDPGQMKQLLLNLAQNALAATEGAGRRPRIRLAALRRDQQVVLEVEDNGVGIPAEERERIFDLFYSTRKGGTGLGLAIVQRIARAHGAGLEVESEPGKGTVFRILLPAAVGSEESRRLRPAVPQPDPTLSPG